MPDLPSGTVTFLFTDIEGSTALWERDRQAMTKPDAFPTQLPIQGTMTVRLEVRVLSAEAPVLLNGVIGPG